MITTYVRQTGRKLKTKILEHKNHKKNIIVQLVITDHRLRHDHEFDWTNIKILNTEEYLNKRLTSEIHQTLFIKL